MVEAISYDECVHWILSGGTPSSSLGAITLKTYPYEIPGYRFSIFNVTFTGIQWTSLRFRYRQHGYENRHFCRQITVTAKLSVPELFYDCHWTKSEYEGTPFTFEYRAEDLHHVEYRQYEIMLPLYKYTAPDTSLQNWTSLMYVDISELPVFVVRWQQAPQRFGVLDYRIQVFHSMDGADEQLEASETVRGTADDTMQLSYAFNSFPSSGQFYFEVCILSDRCADGVCRVSRSPNIIVHSFVTKTLIASSIGCVVLILLVLLILCVWRRRRRKRLSHNTKSPVLLVVYTPSRNSHVKCVLELTQYLRNFCNVEALLDQLDIPGTETKDPFVWCNDAFARADFVMVVSSPSKCCTQEGIFRNVDVVALHLLKERLAKRSHRLQFFTVQLPYCSEQDIPDEARNLRTFQLPDDLDRMLWHVHHKGRYPTIVESAGRLLAPKSSGDLTGFFTALSEAKQEMLTACSCKSTEQDGSAENTKHCVVHDDATEVMASTSMDFLLTHSELMDVQMPFCLDDMILTGETAASSVEPLRLKDVRGVNLDTMAL
ncbi:uncharacterized protein [Periplaneta americana]